MKYDVVIRCKNEIAWLPKVIESLHSQTIKPSKIILVDNGSNDGSNCYKLHSLGYRDFRPTLQLSSILFVVSFACNDTV